MQTPSAFLIDMDDTLYDEHSFVLSGYRAVSEFVAQHFNVLERDVYTALWYAFLKFGRSGAFDRVIEKMELEKELIPKMIGVYRNHSPEITFYPGALGVLRKLRELAPVAIVTDGAASVQRKKIESLGLEREVDRVVLCDEIGAAKPAPDAFHYAAKSLKVDINDCVVIGDDPSHDVMAASTIGITTIRLYTGRFSEMPNPLKAEKVVNVPSFAQILSHIEFENSVH
jgi:putative hydrolase of the HAD superfamily